MSDSSHRVLVTYADGSTAEFETRAERTIIESASLAEVPLAFSCLSGICRACLAEEQSSGTPMLLCQTRIHADAAYRLPYSRAAASVRPTKRRAKLKSFERVSRSVYRLDYQLEYPIAFLPGQYAAIAVPTRSQLERRQYRYFSMANSPTQCSQLRFYARVLPGGHMTTYLRECATIGDLTTIAAPRGAFYLRDDSEPKLFVAGGTGVAPLLSMLQRLAETSSPAPLTLVFGITASEDLFAMGELRALELALPNLNVYVSILRGTVSGVESVPGTVVDALRDAVPAKRLATVANAYLCGPPPMIEATRNFLRTRLTDSASIHNEAFSPTDQI